MRPEVFSGPFVTENPICVHRCKSVFQGLSGVPGLSVVPGFSAVSGISVVPVSQTPCFTSELGVSHQNVMIIFALAIVPSYPAPLMPAVELTRFNSPSRMLSVPMNCEKFNPPS